MKQLDTHEFIKRAKEIHGEKYNYSLVEYKNTRTKVKIICSKHGIFEQTPEQHIRQKQGCPNCNGMIKYDTITFLKKCRKIHNKKYDYSLVEYINNKSNIKIICSKHGLFTQRADSHLNGNGCKKCDSENKKLNKEEFIRISKNIHGQKYKYNNVLYVNSNIPVIINCIKHGDFEITPKEHINGYGCFICDKVEGKQKISNKLKKEKILFVENKQFNNLIFDFYLPEYGVCIEYSKIIEKDKENFCKKNSIDVYIIAYKDDIVEKLDYFFNIYI